MNGSNQAGRGESSRICVLAGGRSSRMGRDKAAIRLGERTLLEIVEESARAVGYPVSVIREDVVASCGPLGGILTGFERFAETRLVFLSCDMPFVTGGLLRELAAGAGSTFVEQDGRVGFPFQIARGDLEVVRRRHAAGEFSLQGLARELGGIRLQCADPERELFNINTPEELEAARVMLER